MTRLKAADERKQEDERRAAGKVGRDAERLLPSGVGADIKGAVQSISRRLQDGDQGGELTELAGVMKELASSLSAKDARRAQEIADLKKEIERINKRHSNR